MLFVKGLASSGGENKITKKGTGIKKASGGENKITKKAQNVGK
jgi:hypothetical protein